MITDQNCLNSSLLSGYRRWGKIISTYITGYMKYINPVTGCIHPDIFALSTETGHELQKPQCSEHAEENK